MDARRQYYKFLPITLKRIFEGRTKSQDILKERFEKINAKHKEAKEERMLRAKEK